MVSWCLLLLLAAAGSCSGAESSKKRQTKETADAAASGTDFFPHFSNFPTFPVHSPPVLPPPQSQDLTALQQTHVLGEFQHRFQQQRFPQFQNQPLLFSQQTEFGQQQQQNNFANQQRLPSQHVIPPPQQQPPPVLFPQPNQFRPAQQKPVFQQPAQQFQQPTQQYQELPQKPAFQPPTQQFQDLPKPAFQQPSQPVFQQPAFQESRPSFVDQRNQFPEPQQREPSFVESAFQDQSFRQQNFRQVNNNPPPQPASLPLPQFQDQSIRAPFFDDNRNSQFSSTRNQPNNFFEQNQEARNPNNQFTEQRNPSFTRSQEQQTVQFPDQRNPAFRNHETNQFANQRFPQENFPGNNPAPPPAPPLPASNFPQPASNDFQSRPSFQHAIPNYQQQSFSPSKPEERPVSFNPNRKPAFLPTQLPKTSEENYNSVEQKSNPLPKRPLLPLIPTDFSEPTTEASSETKGFFLQKSQEEGFVPKNIEYQQNAISPAPPRVPLKPKPEVKEITINLATTPAPDKKDKSSRKEKTQEELINEQIQKLLQGHNLELAGSDPKAPASDLPPVPELPAHLKDKYQIKLVNSEVLSELKAAKKKKEKPATPPSPPPLPDLPDHIKKQYDIKLVQKDELFKQFKIGTGGKLVTNADLVSPLPGNANHGNESTVFLANGQQLEIVHLPKGEEKVTTTTSKPPKELFEELRAKGEIPAGANFELIKHNANGEIEKVNDLTAAKKVTFVLLEEQPDGSVKVQGVKGNSNPEKTDVESLIKKINDGSLKLPPSQSILTNEIPRRASTHKSYVTASPRPEYSATEPATTFRSYTSEEIFSTTNDLPETTFPVTEQPFTTSVRPKSKSRPHFLPTPGYNNFESTSRRHKSSKRPSRRKPTTTTTTAQYEYDDEDYNQRSSNYNGEGPLPQDVVGQESSLQPSPSLTKILQNYGLHEMAKFLDQSGLDTILNETGPYTVFIPTDAAFANLQEQLGGTDKAEDKFRENPRLLSGLLLHHVVPGSFKVSDLQDEMTGVSLAGTQLRVNTYSSEKKDSVVTINGAVVSPNKRDIPVPQGIAHAVDRVLFPLPVGDLVQTLKGDRERRFGKFVKSIEASGLIDMLTGSKTYTVFAPTDKAFAALTDEELDKLLARREAARTIVLRHVMPGTLYSAGMHFYQIKESMERGQKITIQKELGKVKANSAQVVNANIPSTNGVIHVLDTLL